ncbi:MAG: hypothetical protein RL026_2314 [Pseudomonadota bacterium]|jgi:hypothetical protein
MTTTLRTLIRPLAAAVALAGLGLPLGAQAAGCDKACLEGIAEQYRQAYLKRDPSAAPIAKRVRFTENNVEMQFPDGTWDTVTQEVGPPLVLSDVKTGDVGYHTSIMQRDTQTYLAVRLKVRNRQITEIEHIVSTRRNLSSPPTPIADVFQFKRDMVMHEIVPEAQRISRERLIAHANGYFSTLEANNGEIRGTRFSPEATRHENGMKFPEIEKGFRSGRYGFNNRVRDREFVIVDEERQVVMGRGFIDHKGVLDEVPLTDGTKQRSVYREPHSWALLESFKIKDDMIVAVEATFIGAPYYMRSPWTRKPDPKYDALNPGK